MNMFHQFFCIWKNTSVCGVDVKYKKKICRDSAIILICVGWKREIIFSH